MVYRTTMSSVQFEVWGIVVCGGTFGSSESLFSDIVVEKSYRNPFFCINWGRTGLIRDAGCYNKKCDIWQTTQKIVWIRYGKKVTL